MEFEDTLCNPIKPGFYFETFYREIKGEDGYVFYTSEDEVRNKIVWIIKPDNTSDDLYVASSQAKPVSLNSNYSRWLVPAETQKQGLIEKLKDEK